MKQMKYTIEDFNGDFPDEQACLIWLKEYLYPEGIYCKVDKKITPHHLMKTRKSFSCELCGHHVHPTAGTIFHKSSTPLRLWFYAIYLMAATRAGISAKQLQRELGVTYKTSWRMFHQIRKMMDEDSGTFKGKIEVDETFIHPKAERMSKARRARHYAKGHLKGGEVVFGMVERGGRVKAKHISDTTSATLHSEIRANIELGSTIYTDNYLSYKTLDRRGYQHFTTNHGLKEYVKGDNHTQNIENVWSNMKRGLRGVYRHCDAKYLQAYVNEYTFRYNHRNDFQPMFWALMGKVSK